MSKGFLYVVTETHGRFVLNLPMVCIVWLRVNVNLVL